MKLRGVVFVDFRRFLLILFAAFYGVLALKDVSIDIPTAAKTGDTITLRCFFDLEGELLYTLKWYKGTKEFYRYLPKELPDTRTFSLPGVNIDMTKSNHTHLILTNVQQETTGKYKCEVSTEAPNFYTLMVHKYLYVIDVPREDPVLVLDKDLVEMGYILRGNCTSPPSYPAANVTWYLNGKKINESYRQHRSPEHAKTVPAAGGAAKRLPQVTFSSLEIEMDERIFRSGKARFRCVVDIFDLYKKETERVVEEDRPKPRPSSVLGNRETSTGLVVRPARAIFLLVFFVYCLR